ncbi:MAG TPA: ATP-dependent helicase, partial [Burkholderiaceae bacterium]|nr:ATP-dependent helicase [Burkholderiaceae bacterium]
ARHQLHLMLPQRFYVTQQAGGGDRYVYGNRTRFIPGQLDGYFESVAWPMASPGPAQAARPGLAVDLTARMRGMWGPV